MGKNRMQQDVQVSYDKDISRAGSANILLRTQAQVLFIMHKSSVQGWQIWHERQGQSQSMLIF